MHATLVPYALAAAAVSAVWAWLGAEVAMPQVAVTGGEKLPCVSYAPFRGGQSPLRPDTDVPAWQIEEDLARLKTVTDCVRTYATDLGLERVPGIARRHGMQVIQGLWVSRHPEANKRQIDSAITLANRYPDVIRAVVVGNEALLRGEISSVDLANLIRSVKADVPVPVTYADVWEFWLRHRELAEVVDFVTIHILPYWEDFPIVADQAAAHLAAIRERVIAAFPGKDVFIGETGWPSQGRMREGALPSPVNQARVMHDVLVRARQESYPVTLLEAFDQPWKRRLEGTVGGYWGLHDHRSRQPKFDWGAPVTNHSYWRWQAAGGAGFVALVFAVALLAGRRMQAKAVPRGGWIVTASVAALGGVFIGWAVETAVTASFDLGSWIRSFALVAVALGGPLAGAAALHGRVALPSFAAILDRADARPRDPLVLICGSVLIAVTVLALHSALGLAFDPRYRDFPFAALTAAIVPLFLISFAVPRPRGGAGAAETMAAAGLALCAVYILLHEGLTNWQSVWFCVLLLALALTLRRVRDVPD